MESVLDGADADVEELRSLRKACWWEAELPRARSQAELGNEELGNEEIQ